MPRKYRRRTKGAYGPPRQTPWPSLCIALRDTIKRMYPGYGGTMLFCRAVGIDHHQIHHWLDNRREPPTSHWKKLARILEMGDSIDGIFAMCEEARISREAERVAVEAWLLVHPNWAKRSTWRRKYLKAYKLGKPLPEGWSYPPQQRRRKVAHDLALLRPDEVPPIEGAERGGDPVSVPETPRREEGQAPDPEPQ